MSLQASPFPLCAIDATFFPAPLRVSPPRVPSRLIKAVFLVTLPLSHLSLGCQVSAVPMPLWVPLLPAPWLSLELQTLALVEGRW